MKIEDLKTPKPSRKAKVKMWNGTAIKHGGKQWHIYVGATSVRQALELIKKAGFGYMGASHIKNYFSPMWGNDMKGIEPEIGVWGKDDENRFIHDPVERLL
jgi:hypothetical protein